MQGFSKHITQKQTATSKPPKGSDEESESENIVLSPFNKLFENENRASVQTTPYSQELQMQESNNKFCINQF